MQQVVELEADLGAGRQQFHVVAQTRGEGFGRGLVCGGGAVPGTGIGGDRIPDRGQVLAGLEGELHFMHVCHHSNAFDLRVRPSKTSAMPISWRLFACETE